MTAPPVDGDEVAPDEDLRRAIHRLQLNEFGEPTSAGFKKANLSLDVASLASLAETRNRFPGKSIAIIACQSFRTLGYRPEHNPIPENASHAIVREKLTASDARKIAAAIKAHIPVDA